MQIFMKNNHNTTKWRYILPWFDLLCYLGCNLSQEGLGLQKTMEEWEVRQEAKVRVSWQREGLPAFRGLKWAQISLSWGPPEARPVSTAVHKAAAVPVRSPASVLGLARRPPLAGPAVPVPTSRKASLVGPGPVCCAAAPLGGHTAGPTRNFWSHVAQPQLVSWRCPALSPPLPLSSRGHFFR